MLSRIVPTTTTAGTYNDTNFRSLNSVSICRYKNNYLWNLNRRRVVGPVMVVKADEQVNSSSVVLKEKKEKSLGDRLRLGSLTEDGLCYKERFVIRCYEVGINKTATVETIANLLQLSIRSCNPIHSGYISKAKKKPVTEISHDLFQDLYQIIMYSDDTWCISNDIF